jgi:ATP-dependent Clp protease ATP-binding subunit ClpA
MDSESGLTDVWVSLGIPLEQARGAIRVTLAQYRGTIAAMSRSTVHTVAAGARLAKRMGSKKVEPEHILIGLFAERRDPSVRALEELGCDLAPVNAALMSHLTS